jgi:protein-disulfide isomerase
MIHGLLRVAALSTPLLLAACGGGEPEPSTDATDDISRGLLSSVGRDSAAGTPRVPADPRAARPGPQEVDVTRLGFDWGDTLAPVQIVEMSDYGCGYCRKFHEETWPVLREEFIATGKVRWKFLPFVSGMFDNSLAATEAAECALAQGPDAFLALNDRLWDGQRAWKSTGDPLPVVREMAEAAGVDVEAWEACMEEDRRVQRIGTATAVARDLGIRGTPTFLIQGYPPVQGALPTETFVEILNRVHAVAARPGAEGGGGGPDGGGGG